MARGKKYQPEQVVDLQVHLIQRLLDMHDVLSRHLDQAAAMPPESPYSADHPRRTEARSQQTDRVQVLEPLAIGDVRFASWHVLHVLCVDQADLEAASFKYLIDRNPVDAG